MARLSKSAAAAQLTIDLGALSDNYLSLAARAAPATTAAVVKADAYGLGVGPVAQALVRSGCANFFVATLAEALDLRGLIGPEPKVYVLNGLHAGSERECAEAGIVPVLNTLGQARRWEVFAADCGERLAAAIQIDSGMSRLGLSAGEVAILSRDRAFFASVALDLVMSHLACADTPDHEANLRQTRAFEALADQLPPAPRSLANSGGIFLGEPFRNDLVRAGVSLYGGEPNVRGFAPMRPVVSLQAKVLQLRDIEQGQGVGYGLTYTPEGPATLATIGVGYADGWPRSLSNRGAAYFAGARLPIVGRVSMDSLTLDVTALSRLGVRLAEGDQVELLGERQSLEDVADQAGTIAYEILTSLGRRYYRRYRGQETRAVTTQAARKPEVVQ